MLESVRRNFRRRGRDDGLKGWPARASEGEERGRGEGKRVEEKCDEYNVS